MMRDRQCVLVLQDRKRKTAQRTKAMMWLSSKFDYHQLFKFSAQNSEFELLVLDFRLRNNSFLNHF